MSKKLLLADDSITIQKVIGITFANEDYDLTIVDNGEVALEKARSVRPDLILADVFMPGKNGYELTAAVKEDPSLEEVPVLLLAGTFEPFDEDKARKSGADGWIAKPFESQALIDRVEELLAQVPRPAESVEEQVAPVEMPVAAPEEDEGDWGDAFDLGEDEGLPADDDLWGAVSFGEEDLTVEPEEAGEEPFAFEEEPLAAEEAVVEKASADQAVSPVAEGESFAFEEESLEPGEESSGGVSGVGAEEVESFEQREESPMDSFAAAAEEEEAFVFEEDPLEEMEEPPSGEGPLAEPFAPETKEETLVLGEEEPAGEVSSPLWDEPEEEILTLDEADIIEEEELEAEPEPALEEASAPEEEDWADDWGWEEPAETGSAPAEDLFAESEPLGEIPQTVEEDFSFLEEGPEWGVAEESAGEEEPFAPLEETPPTVPPIAPFEDVSIPAAPATVESQVEGLSEDELERIVEKVAGTVIERLANTVLEKIAWEVVPDLAESLIKEELRQIKEEAGTGG